MCYFLLLVTDNGNLDESAVKRFEQLMSQKVNDIEFPTLQQQQLQPQKKQRGRYDLQIQHNVRETPPAQDEASSSNSVSVANVDDPTPENMDAVQEEPPQIPDGPNVSTSNLFHYNVFLNLEVKFCDFIQL